jgi:hypothetical protein
MPAAIRPLLGVTATVLESLFGISLFLGVCTPLAAAGTGVLLLLFGTAMAISFGSNHPLIIRFSQPWAVLYSSLPGAFIRLVQTLFSSRSCATDGPKDLCCVIATLVARRTSYEQNQRFNEGDSDSP